MSEEGKSKYYKSLLGLENDDLGAVREDIDAILRQRADDDVIEKIAVRAAELAVDMLKPSKKKASKSTKKVKTLKSEDDDE